MHNFFEYEEVIRLIRKIFRAFVGTVVNCFTDNVSCDYRSTYYEYHIVRGINDGTVLLG